MRSWWAALVVVFVLAVTHCGGSSTRREPAGDGFEDGGTSGSAGARGGTAGASIGGATNPGGGRGGAGATTASGGRAPAGGSGGSRAGGGGFAGGDGGDAGSAGSAGEPGCTPVLGSDITDCSREDTCLAVECGEPWSIFDDAGCGRTQCTETGTCPAGERCVPAVVAGKYDDPCFYHPDSCSYSDDECLCAVWEECFPLAVCLPEDEFPPSRDCPIDRAADDAPADCFLLSRAVMTLEAYRDGSEFFFPYEPPPVLAASVESCAMRLADALQAECD
jgi:hypothetical protein